MTADFAKRFLSDMDFSTMMNTDGSIVMTFIRRPDGLWSVIEVHTDRGVQIVQSLSLNHAAEEFADAKNHGFTTPRFEMRNIGGF